MNKLTLAACAALALACNHDVPEGVYACRPDTVATDCPAGWSCRMDSRCWSTPDAAPDAGPRQDAAMSIPDAGRDAPVLDAGCVSSTETCNDADDDCDGMIDEDLALVSDPVVFSTSDGSLRSMHLVGVDDGFVVVSEGEWRRLRTDGSVAAGPAAIAGPYQISSGIAFDGTRVILALPGELHALSPMTGAELWVAPFVPALLTGDRLGASARVTDASETRASFYELVHPASGQDVIWRHRVDTGGAPPVEVHSARAVTAFIDDTQTTWSVLRAGPDEIIATADGTGIHLRRGDAGDGSTFQDLGVVVPATFRVNQVALSAASSAVPIAADNPLLLAWQDTAATHFIIVTQLYPSVTSAPSVDLDGATPENYMEVTSDFLSAVALQGVRGEDVPGHFFIIAAVAVHTTAHEALAVWEISHSSPAGRAITVPSNTPVTTQDVAVGWSGTVVRIAGPTETGVGTRSLGCH